MGIERKTESAILLAGLCLALGCSTATPRIVEVSKTKRLKTVSPGYEEMFRSDRASKFQFEAKDLPQAEQGQEFFVRWRAAALDRVKFEYRQVNLPNKVGQQSVAPAGNERALFRVPHEEIAQAGSVSAWRVTLWKDGAVIAEKRSALW
jgi:hypothetical protein